MTQPPLSRALRSLERDVGAQLLERSATGVAPTPAGHVLYREARAILKHAERAREQAFLASQPLTITVGLLADTADHLTSALLTHFHDLHPRISIQVHETDLTDPSAGLRTGLSDVAITRAPLDESGIDTFVVGSEPIGVVVRDDDPLARETATSVGALAHRDWVTLATGAGEAWHAYWSGAPAHRRIDRPAATTIQECLQTVLWGDVVALAPLGQPLPAGLAAVPVTDREVDDLLVAWRTDHVNEAIRSFIDIAEGSA